MTLAKIGLKSSVNSQRESYCHGEWRHLLLLLLATFTWPVLVGGQSRVPTSDVPIDYLAQLNAPLADIDPNDNAAVFLAELCWAHIGGDRDDAQIFDVAPAYRRQLAEALGCPELNDLPWPRSGRGILDWPDLEDPTLFLGYDGHPWKSENHPDAAAWLDELGPVLDQFRDAPERYDTFFWPRFVYDERPTRLLFQVWTPSNSFVMILSRFLSYRSYQSVGEGRLEEAWRDVSGILSWSELLPGPMPFPHDYSVAIMLRAMALRLAIDLIQTPGVSDALLEEIQRSLSSVQPMDRVSTVLEAQRWVAMDAWDQVIEGRVSLGAWFFTVRSFPINQLSILDRPNVMVDSPFFRRSVGYQRIDDVIGRLRSIEHLDRSRSDGLRHHAVSELWPDKLSTQEWVDRYPNHASTLNIEWLVRRGTDQAIADWMIPWTISGHYSGAYDLLSSRTNLVSDMFVQRTVGACAQLRYFRHQGRWASSWGELIEVGLIQSAPIDLFDGEPLRIRQYGDGLRIYSIDRDRRDDGGFERSELRRFPRFVQPDRDGDLAIWMEPPVFGADWSSRLEMVEPGVAQP